MKIKVILGGKDVTSKNDLFVKQTHISRENEIIKMAIDELKHLKEVKKINKGYENLDDYTRGFYEGRIFICEQILKKVK